MSAAALTAKQIVQTLEQIMARYRKANPMTDAESDAVLEAIRRVNEHERLVRDVLPDLRSRVPATG